MLTSILKALEVLDASDLIPAIFCEASDLPKQPSFSLDPVGEQVQANTQALLSLKSIVSLIEVKLSSLIDLSNSSNACSKGTVDTSGNTVQQNPPYAHVASINPPPSNTASAPARKTAHPVSRESNVVVFSLPQCKVNNYCRN